MSLTIDNFSCSGELKLSVAQFEHLHHCSKAHYDSKCQGEQQYFANHVAFCRQSKQDATSVYVNPQRLDTWMKVAEMGGTLVTLKVIGEEGSDVARVLRQAWDEMQAARVIAWNAYAAAKGIPPPGRRGE